MGTKRPSAKPASVFITLEDAVKRSQILEEGYRQLCSALLSYDGFSPLTRSRILALQAALAQVEMGDSDGA